MAIPWNDVTTVTKLNSRALLPATRNALAIARERRRRNFCGDFDDILELGPGVGVSLGCMRGIFPTAGLDLLGMEEIDPDRRFVDVENIFKVMRAENVVDDDACEVSFDTACAYMRETHRLRHDLGLRRQYIGNFFDDNPIWRCAGACYDLIYEQYGPIEKTRYTTDPGESIRRLGEGIARIVSLLKAHGVFMFISSVRQFELASEFASDLHCDTRFIPGVDDRHCTLIRKR